MSSSRRRGRAPGGSAQPVPPTAATQPEVADVPSVETAESEAAPTETDAAVEAVSAERPEIEGAPETVEAAPVEADVLEDAPEDASQDEPSRPEADETSVVAASEEASAPAEDAGPSPALHAAEAVETAAADTLAQAALLPALAEPARVEAVANDTVRRVTRFGATSAFVPSLAPIGEIQAKLFAFARGEGEAALAHFQALARVRSPAEAIRLQVTEIQRAADASLTCFSDIVQSANRFGDNARRP